MNLPQFLRQIDAGMSEMTREMLEAFVHELARTLPENRRSQFLDTMHTVRATGHPPALSADKSAGQLADEIKEITEVLKSINNGEKYLDSEYNEEWDDWYNPDADEVLFSDPQHLLPDIERGIELVHECIDTEEYSLGCGLAELLSALEVSAEGDYCDYDGAPLGLHELYESQLLRGSLEGVVRECLFLAYMGNGLSDRAEELFCMMGNFQYYEVKLEDIMQIGSSDLPEFQEFLPLWIDYLGKQTGRGVKKLLEEAQEMMGDDAKRLDTARKFVDKHPELYEQILEKGLGSGEDDRLFYNGMEALEKIPESYVIRSRIALMTGEYACRINQDAAMEHCWLEAFRSAPSVVNYMRMRFLTRDWSCYKKQMMKIYNEAYTRTKARGRGTVGYYDPNSQKEYELGLIEYCTLLFWEEDFDGVIKLGMEEKKALGWSSTFMKEGLALFLLLLFDGDVLPAGMNSMLQRAVFACGFHTEEYVKGTGMNTDKNDSELFWALFCQWKKEVRVPEETAARWLQKIEQLVSMRTEGIMEANRRNYYGECAAFIAALGEVQESHGMNYAKTALMNSYKTKYARRRAFHQELRHFGMR